MSKVFYHTSALLLFLSLAGAACAAEVNLNGVVGNKALLIIDSGKPHWLTAGETSPEGIKLISVGGDSAVIEVNGKRQALKLGQNERLAGGRSGAAGTRSVVLTADGQGHFVTTAMINGISVRVLVDTGASLISMSSSEAKRLGINYTAGEKSATSTANGIVPAYRVKLDEVRLGDITINNVDGMVHASDNLPIVLLGMSFLNRMEMKRDGETMTLTKRF
jgi:aspartyl protease family protein